MDNVYSLNPQILPKAPNSHKKHPYLADTAIVAVVAALVIGLLYWWSVSSRNPNSTVSVQQQADKRAIIEQQLLASLKTAPTPSSQEVSTVVTQLKKSQPTSSGAEQSVLSSLRAK